jgi:hypothetical protein
MLNFLAKGESAVDDLRQKMDSVSERIGLENVTLLAPIAKPNKFFGVSLNYDDHIEETGREKPEYPTFFNKMKDYKQNRRFIISVILGFSVFLLTIPPILYLISRYLIFPYFVDSSYITSLNFILGIGFSYVFYGYYLILYPFLAWKNKTKIIGAIFTIAAIINLILNGIMIPFYGLNGAIFSTIITYFAMTVLVLIAVVRIDYSNEDSFKNS